MSAHVAAGSHELHSSSYRRRLVGFLNGMRSGDRYSTACLADGVVMVPAHVPIDAVHHKIQLSRADPAAARWPCHPAAYSVRQAGLSWAPLGAALFGA